MGAEDGEKLLPDDLSLLPLGRTRLCPLRWRRRLPVRQAAGRQRMSPKWVGPVLLPLLGVVDSAVLEVWRLAIRRHADWVSAVAGVLWRAVGDDVRAVAADRPKAVLLVVVLESWCGPLRRRAM